MSYFSAIYHNRNKLHFDEVHFVLELTETTGMKCCSPLVH